MNIAPFIALREQLKIEAIAGTRQMEADSLLTEILEAILQLNKDSSVFLNLVEMVRMMYITNVNQRGSMLLNALALCDEIIVEQGTVNLEGEVKPLFGVKSGRKKMNIPEYHLTPLLKSITGISETPLFTLNMKREHPEYFEDYRVQTALIKALGENQGKLINIIEGWLSDMGETIIPLLKKNFDPTGNNDMVRRLRIIEKIAGKKENEFYTFILDTAIGEVREKAIYALRHEKENGELLVQLAETETEKAREKARWALALLDLPCTWTYFEKLVEEEPEQAYQYMEGSISKESSYLIGKRLAFMIDRLDESDDEISEEFQKELQILFDVLPGKSGREIVSFYYLAAAHRFGLDDLKIDGKAVSFRHIYKDYVWKECVFSEIIPSMLYRALIYYPDNSLIEAAEYLYHTYGIKYAKCAIVAAILSKDAETAYQSIVKMAASFWGSVKKTKEKKEFKDIIESAFCDVFYDKEEERQVIQVYFFDTPNEMNYIVEQPLKEPLCVQWYKDLIAGGENYDNTLIKILHPDNKKTCRILRNYFDIRVNEAENNEKYILALKELGRTDFKGMIINYCRKKRKLEYLELKKYVDIIPMDKEKKAIELEEYIKKSKNSSNSIKGLRREVYQMIIDELRGKCI